MRIYTVTYHELNQILREHGFALVNPYHNHIDVVRLKSRSRFFRIFDSQDTHDAFLAQITFRGWKCQVGQACIRTVRERTGLTAEHGFDSQVFFYGKAPVSVLLDMYADPLRRLANR
jgi:death-on-curing protein